jgi:alkyl hydroperoxide reductase subunit AhpC
MNFGYLYENTKRFMKGIFPVLLSFLLFSMSSFAKGKPLANLDADTFDISIKIRGLKNENVLLAYHYGDKKYILDSLHLDASGATRITGKRDIPKGVYIIAIPSLSNKYFEILISEKKFGIETDTLDFFKFMKISNSQENKLFYEFMHFASDKGKDADSLQKVLVNISDTSSVAYKKAFGLLKNIDESIINERKRLIEAYPNTFYAHILKMMIEVPMPEYSIESNHEDSMRVYNYAIGHYLDNITFSDSGLVRTPILLNKLTDYIKYLYSPHPDSISKACDVIINKCAVDPEMFKFCTTQLLSKYANSQIMGQEAIYVHLVENYYLTGKAYWQDSTTLEKMKQRVIALKPSLLGKPASNFAVLDTNGKMRIFLEETVKHKYTLLVFWNSDCGHCNEEIPKLYKFWQDSLKTYDVGVFSVGTDHDKEKISQFVNEHELYEWQHGYDPNGNNIFRQQYDVISTPLIVLVDQAKIIRAKRIEYRDLPKFIENLEKYKD